MKRWVCPRCKDGVLGLARPRRDDVRRYCLSCSAETGRLVERSCPSAVAKRERAVKRSSEREVERNARELEQRKLYPNVLHLYADLWRKLSCWPRALRSKLTVRRGTRRYSSGTSYGWSGRVVVTAGTDRVEALTTLLHELAHQAAPIQEGHGPRFHWLFTEAITEVCGEPPAFKWGRPNKQSDFQAGMVAVEKALQSGRIPTLWTDESVGDDKQLAREQAQKLG